MGEYIIDERDAFRLFIKGAGDNGYKIEFNKIENPELWININEGYRSNLERKKLNELLFTTVIFKLRLSKDKLIREFNIYSAVSPAAVNRGMVRQNKCVVKYSELNKILIFEAPKELLKEVLKSFFNDSISTIIKYNHY